MSENRGNPTNFGGADDSTNYLAYPTLMALPRQPEPAQQTVEELEAELQQLQARAAELEAEYQRLQARKEALQALLARSRGSRMADAETFDYGYSLDGVTDRNKITEIHFLNTLKNAPANAADLSAAKDRGVLCWTEGTVQYIAGKGGVVAGSDCRKLFSGYKKVTTIRFDGNFNTSNVTNMRAMFRNCFALSSLNLSGFDTSNVTDMGSMFQSCTALRSLNLSGFDTSNVTSMYAMFGNCDALSSLNLSGFDTSNVTDLSYMFFRCTALRSLNLSGWDTFSVKNMEKMFHDCKSLTNFNPRWLNTANAVTTDMYTGTRWA